MRMRPSVLAPAVAVLLALTTQGHARAQGADAIDALLHQDAGLQTREDQADIPAEPVAPESLLRAPLPEPGDICRVMTDMAQRSRRARVCMPRAGWEALVRAARAPGARRLTSAKLGRAWRSETYRR